MALAVRMDAFKALVENPVFLSSISSWLFAQLVKAAIVLLKSHKGTVREILVTIAWRTGGMPSSHAALVSAMATSAAFKWGVGSDIFIISLFFAVIVMRDAMGVRRSAGLQARTINFIGRQLTDRGYMEFRPVKEIHGHSPLEVVVGALLGIFIAAAYAYL
jgi:acid phosphatase family membrane protein YuiD